MKRREYEKQLRKWEAEGYEVSELRRKWFPARKNRKVLWSSITTIVITGIAVTVWQVWPALSPAINYSDFSSTEGLTLLGEATQYGDVLRLTPDDVSETSAGAAWLTLKQPVDNGFETTFQFQMSPKEQDGCDGFAFVIQNHDVQVWSRSGVRLGYAQIHCSVAVEFDTCRDRWTNYNDDNRVSVHTHGEFLETASIGSVVPGFDLNDGAVHMVKIIYYQNTLLIFLDNMENPLLEIPLDINDTLSSEDGKAWVGFTAGSGYGFGPTHDILSWEFTPAEKDT